MFQINLRGLVNILKKLFREYRKGRQIEYQQLYSDTSYSPTDGAIFQSRTKGALIVTTDSTLDCKRNISLSVHAGSKIDLIASNR